MLRIRDRGINPDYVMRAKGPKLLTTHHTNNKAKLLTLMDELNEKEQRVVVDLAAALLRARANGQEDPPEGERK